MKRLALLWLCASCKHPSPPHVDAIEVHVHTLGPDALPVPDQAELVAMTAAAMTPGPLVYDPAGKRSTRLVVTVEIGWQPGSLHSQSRAVLEPRADDAGTMRITRDAQVEKANAAKRPTLDEVRNHLRRALALTVGSATASEQLWLGPPANIRTAIADTDPDLRLDAIEFAGLRHDRDSVPALLAILRSDDQVQRDRAVGALAAIGDVRAVHPLAELAKLDDLDELPKIIDSVSRIGGPEAEAYLTLVAEAHQVPELKEMAKRALEHLHERQKH